MTAVTTPPTSAAGTTAAAHAALELRGVDCSYGDTQVLRDVSLVVRPGRVTALIGPNGAGKTTSLRVASGLLRPTTGTVLLGGEDITGVPTHRRSTRGLCHVPEGRGVYRNLTVQENLTMQAPRGTVAAGIERATAAFPVLGQRLQQKAGTLSGGEQQMLSLSAAYLRNPSVVLVDEPSLGLAPIIVDVVFEFLQTLGAEGVSLLLVDQFAIRSLSIADHAYVLRRGRVAYDGPADELLDGNMFEQYIGEGA
ncbi:ABC transporter ATP-binding protein [Nocardioides zeae]|uniref:ABC transporter ATP-binding protein n=1 Tax=Nocardioides imazamoxiresistens TaxID=3231893 RepID=A0ABU3PTC7_9ACTN|nr:ABC transporter ATP-binding protein [Nocardioides zeae]MDT9592146.1 ABC transporter ATP-binding protein [Nocardioides zeae]